MIWAVDQDTYNWEALSALLGKEVDGGDLLHSGSHSDLDEAQRSTLYSAYNGEDCYVTGCIDFGKGQCKTGYSVLEYVHSGGLGVIQKPDDEVCRTGDEGDEDSQYRLICCPTEAMPESCAWAGSTSIGGMCLGGGYDFCGDGKFELIQDKWTKRTGGDHCFFGARSLCCNTSPELELCTWTECGGTCSDDKPYMFEELSFWDGSSKFSHSVKYPSSAKTFFTRPESKP